MSPGTKILARSLFPAAALFMAATPAAAQIIGIEAVVNEEVISALDVENRLRLDLMSSDLPDNDETRERLKPQVLRALVNEKLQTQEARRLNVPVEDSEIEEAERLLEAQNDLPAGGLGEFLRSRGLEKSTLTARIRAEIAWRKVIRRRILPRIDVGDEEVDEVHARLRSRRGTRQRLASEIYLAVDTPGQSEDVRRQALRLVGQLRSGAPFAAVARQFSQGTTSRSGGDIGWIGEGELPDRLDRALVDLDAGDVSEPVRVPGGYYIFHVRDQRRVGEASTLDVRVDLKEILIPLSPSASRQAEQAGLATARRISERVRGCEAFDGYGRDIDIGRSGDLGTVRLGDMPKNIRDAIDNLAVGEASEPLRMDEGIRILMVCGRTAPAAVAPSRDAIRERLGRQQLEMMARRYLRDLRRDAIIETR